MRSLLALFVSTAALLESAQASVLVDTDRWTRTERLPFSRIVIETEVEAVETASRSVALCATTEPTPATDDGTRSALLVRSPACDRRTMRRRTSRATVADRPRAAEGFLGSLSGTPWDDRDWRARPAARNLTDEATADEAGSDGLSAAAARIVTSLSLPKTSLATAALPGLRPSAAPPALTAPAPTPTPPALALFASAALFLMARGRARQR